MTADAPAGGSGRKADAKRVLDAVFDKLFLGSTACSISYSQLLDLDERKEIKHQT